MTAVHLSLVGKASRSAHTRIVSGPNPKLAMLRALAMRATTIAPVAWAWGKRGAALVARTPGWVGQAVLATLSSPSGYATAVSATATGIKAAYRLLDRAVCLTGRGIATLTGLAASSIVPIAPTFGHALIAAHADAIDAVNAAHEHATRNITAFGRELEQLAHAPLVKTTTTRAAAVASALLVVHLLTKGAIAFKAIQATPALAGLVVAVTSPWWLVLAVTGITCGAIAASAYLSNSTGTPPGDLVVNVGTDGSITVTGMPANTSERDKQRIAEHAAREAVARLEGQTPTPNRQGARRTQRRTVRPSSKK